MITALNPATLGGQPPLIDYLTLAESHGFGGVEVSIEEVVQQAQQSSWSDVRALFEQHGVAPAIFGLPLEWRKDDHAFNNGLSKLKEYARAASQIGCKSTGTWLPPAIDTSYSEFSKLISKRFFAVAEILADYNIKLALEFVGPDTCRSGPNAHGKHPFIHTLGQTLDLIEDLEVPHDNVGVLLDSFHWYTSHGTVENLLMLTSDQVVHVHINDAPNVPISKQLDFDRLLPGDGVINLVSFLKALAFIGYSGYVAVETFNVDLTRNGPEEAAERTERAVERLLASL